MQLAALRRFCLVLGVDPEAQAAESVARYHLEVSVPADRVLQLTVTHVRDLVDAFGTALTLTVQQTGVVVARIPGTQDADLPGAVERLSILDPARQADLTLTIDKGELLLRHGGDAGPCHVILYLFKKRMLKALDISLSALDEALFVDRATPTLVVTLEGRLHYQGQCLTIASLRRMRQLKATMRTVPPIGRALRRRMDRVREAMAQKPGWIEPGLKVLTPVHLLRRSETEASATLCAILRRHLCHLAILYTATRVVPIGSTFQVDYAGADQTVTLELTRAPVPAELDDALSQLALWPHSGGTHDRLTILQTVAAREVRTLQPVQSYASLLERLPHILGEARWQHRVFVGQKIDKHFEQVQRFAGDVAEVGARLSAAIDASTKGLTETLLAAIGVVVAAMLAGLIKNEVQGAIFEVSMRAYAIYVAAQFLLRLGSVAHGYWVLHADLAGRRAFYVPILGPSLVASLMSPLRRHRAQFWTWFAIAALCYVALAAGTWLAAGRIGPYLVDLGLLSPLPPP